MLKAKRFKTAEGLINFEKQFVGEGYLIAITFDSFNNNFVLFYRHIEPVVKQKRSFFGLFNW